MLDVLMTNVQILVMANQQLSQFGEQNQVQKWQFLLRFNEIAKRYY